MTARRAAQVFIVGMFLFAVVFAGWGLYQYSRHQGLVAELAERGVEVAGTVAAKSKSDPSDGSSVSPSYIVQVEYRHGGRAFTRPFAVSRSRWDGLAAGDPLAVTLLPDAPRRALLTEVVAGESDHRGFVVVE